MLFEGGGGGGGAPLYISAPPAASTPQRHWQPVHLHLLGLHSYHHPLLRCCLFTLYFAHLKHTCTMFQIVIKVQKSCFFLFPQVGALVRKHNRHCLTQSTYKTIKSIQPSVPSQTRRKANQIERIRVLHCDKCNLVYNELKYMHVYVVML